MEQAVAVARRCVSEEGRISPKVGAVVVREGVVLGEAFRGELAPGDHAEYTLLETKLGNATLAGATLFTTLEPCTSRNSPKIPCAERIAERRIARVVIGVLDPNDAIRGRGELRLREARIEIARFDPDLMAQIEELNREFTRQQVGAQHSGYTAHGVGNLTPSAFSHTSKRERLVKLPEAAPISDAVNFSHVQSVQPGLDAARLLKDTPNMQVSQAVGSEGPIMGGSPNPLMLRRRLRTELRAARLKKGLAQEQVAKAMEWSLSKMNRIEKAKSGISTNDLKTLLRLYDITDKERTEELLALARAARQTPWWRRRYSEVAPARLLELMDYESAASAISQFETMFVPEILQTKEYARAVLRTFYGEESAAERVAALVDLRTGRGDLLIGENAPKFFFILDEPVIRRLAGTPSIARRQLLHLVDVAGLSNVTIQVAPLTAGLHPGMRRPFEVVQFDDTPDENIVFCEEPGGDFISDDTEETKYYLEAFRRITEKSLGPSDTVSRLRKVANEMT